MINVTNSNYRNCESCYSNDDVYEISLGITKYSVHTIAVCNTCFKQISKKVMSDGKGE